MAVSHGEGRLSAPPTETISFLSEAPTVVVTARAAARWRVCVPRSQLVRQLLQLRQREHRPVYAHVPRTHVATAADADTALAGENLIIMAGPQVMAMVLSGP